MSKHKNELRHDLEYFSQQQQIQKLQNHYELLNNQMAGGQADPGPSSKAAKKLTSTKLNKQVSNSNSTPDFQMMQFDSQGRSKVRSNIAHQGQQNAGKKAGATTKGYLANPVKHQSEVQSARQNVGGPQAPAVASSNPGNFTQRVQTSKPNSKTLSNINPSSGPNPTKKQILKNLQHIKTNNEDYKIMQNISNQMGGQILGHGPHTTKHSKGNDKSFQNLKAMFKQSLQTGKGGTSLGKVIPQTLVQEFQGVEEPELLKNTQKSQSSKSQHKQNRAKSAGKKKTLSISPQRPGPADHSTAAGYNPKADSGLAGGTYKAPKTNRGNTLGGAQPSLPLCNNQWQQFLLSTSSNNSKKMRDNMKDLNYFIKTIEKFSKSSNLPNESGPQMYNMRQHPQIMTQNQLTAQGGLNPMTSVGSSTPQTPKDMIQGILLNLGDQMKLYNSSQGTANKKVKSVSGNKSKSTAAVNQVGQSQYNLQLFEHLKNQQQLQGISAQTAESIQNQLK